MRDGELTTLFSAAFSALIDNYAAETGHHSKWPQWE
jgi:hypothetical protein